MMTFPMSYWFDSREFWILAIVPPVLHILFPKLWWDPCFIVLAFLFLKGKILPAFSLLFFWSIMKGIFMLAHPGRELLVMAVAWYLFAIFSFEEENLRMVAVVAVSFVWLFFRVFLPETGLMWHGMIFLKFFAIFTLVNISFLLILKKLTYRRGMP